MEEPCHVVQIFADESGWDGANRFGSLAKIVGIKPTPKILNNELGDVLKQFGITEFKFTDVNGKRKLEVAKRFIEILMKYIATGKIGVYVLVWDKHDSRHNIKGRCDVSNLCRMYYHNLKSIKKQYKIDCKYEFFPDEFSAINWNKDIIKFLSNRKLSTVTNSDPDLFNFYSNLKITYTTVKELKSVNFPILQLADLMAGLCRTSRQNHSIYREWCQSKSNQTNIFENPITPPISKTLDHKFMVIDYFKSQCDKYRLSVNISRNGYLRTFKPSNRMSIWHYDPQTAIDKAPVR